MLLPTLGYMLIYTQSDYENKLSHSRIVTALGRFPYAELSDQATALDYYHLRRENLDLQQPALSRICHCDIDKKTYMSEIEYRAQVSRKIMIERRTGHVNENRYDIGYIEENYRRKSLWIISPILKEVILHLLMPHPGLCSRTNL
jgi:hypothetical protein